MRIRVRVEFSHDYIVEVANDKLSGPHSLSRSQLEELAENTVRQQMESMLLKKLIRPEYFTYKVIF